MAKRKSASGDSVPTLSFEEALDELKQIVTDLEDGASGLETSLERFEHGIKLLKTCYSILEAAESKVELLTRFTGEESTSTVPFDVIATVESVRETTILSSEQDSASNGGPIDEDSLF